MSERRGLLIILSSPSGAGKSTLARKLRDWDASLQFSISATTRKPRVGETDAKDYYFVSEDDFRKYVNEGEMLEHARVFNNYYGSPKGPVQKAIDNGRDVLFDVDWQGAQQISNSSRFLSCRRRSGNCVVVSKHAVRMIRIPLPCEWRKAGMKSAIGMGMIMCW